MKATGNHGPIEVQVIKQAKKLGALPEQVTRIVNHFREHSGEVFNAETGFHNCSPANAAKIYMGTYWVKEA